MKLIIDTIYIENLDTIIFVVGIILTFIFILFKIFSKEEVIEENKLDYYSRHNFPIKEQNSDTTRDS
tara:strand:+ start:391 stop:591 length:201 start_codon:yes stop_codon:yes gene_type:complete